jgi:hypothetical protein
MHKWTIVYLIRCLNDAYQVRCLTELLAELYRNEVPPDVCLVFAINITIKDVRLIDGRYKPPAGSNPCAMTTLFYQLDSAGSGHSGRKSRLVEIAPEDFSFDPLKKEYVKKYFASILQGSRFTANQYMLFTWGHGAAYGLFYDPSNPGPGQKYDMLSMDDLNDAITATFGSSGQKINVVVMMNCYMQFFDTGYTLRLAGVDYLVASVSGATFMGYNYRKLFGTLLKDTAMTPIDLAKLAVSSINDKNLSNVSLRRELYEATFYTVNLGMYEKLAGYMSELGEKLIAELPANVEKIRAARNQCQVIHPYYNLIDFFRFVQGLRNAFGANWQPDLVGKILHLPDAFVLASFHGKGLKRGKGQSYPLGYSICIPLEGASSVKFYQTYFDPGSPYATPFSKAYQWSAFVKAFYAACPQSKTFLKDLC